MTKHRIVLAFTFALLAGCASRQPEYTSQDGISRPREDAEKAYAQSLAPSKTADRRQLDKPLMALYTPFPDYPRDLRNAGVVGNVRTRFTIGEDGKVSNPSVFGSPHPTLAAMTLDSIMRWRFEPPMVDGKPSRILATHQFIFKLE